MFSFDGSEIDYVECYKYLGIWLDSKLSFETHIHVCMSTLGCCSFQFSTAHDLNYLQQTLKLSSLISLSSFKNVIQSIVYLFIVVSFYMSLFLIVLFVTLLCFYCIVPAFYAAF